MQIAHELKITMKQFYTEFDQDELGWWMAYFQVKQEREERARAQARRRRGRPPLSD